MGYSPCGYVGRPGAGCRLDGRKRAASTIRAALGGPADLVMSDMASPTTGHGATDRLRVAALCEAALDLAEPLLTSGGCFLAKLREGGGPPALQARLCRAFARVRHVKPAASRKESSERYVVATGYRGASPPSHAERSSPDEPCE